MNITLGNRFTFFLNGSDYMIYDGGLKKCIVLFYEDKSANSNFWLLGDPFMRAYITVHDMDN